MFFAVASQSSWLCYPVTANSLIHTVMYSYYFMKTLWPKQEIKAARYLTQAQMTQFVIGIALSLYILVQGDECDSAASRFCLAFLQVYGWGLLILFAAFAKTKYKRKKV